MKAVSRIKTSGWLYLYEKRGISMRIAEAKNKYKEQINLYQQQKLKVAERQKEIEETMESAVKN